MNNGNQANKRANNKPRGNAATTENRRRDSGTVNVNLGPVENRIDVHTFIGDLTFN
ncbi:hypothetical protein SAMN02982929_05260 [Saccharopolyspora kobensis]|uniref:Uncharacterized protein n=1 Tax=Saccharopolyspora kobensis TaxID=146035 RepID=A0A1H6DZ26_9PSEU|nr:hypothetical protein [Saccharopolyspora kobensis]SEG90578.1 hypothetical protein SAMN02982929_05260 [Saccharopolyspora kobensis]SFD92224.1 hypothetical protein SAMN05216506_107236 [Saccharopolyspora kobensis]